MNETLPLLTQIKHGRHPGVLHELRDLTVSVPLPLQFQAEPASPFSADVSPRRRFGFHFIFAFFVQWKQKKTKQNKTNSTIGSA